MPAIVLEATWAGAVDNLGGDVLAWMASTMQVNGAAAHLTEPGHRIIVASFGGYDEADLERYQPAVVHVDEDNRALAVDNRPEVLVS